MPTVDEVAVKPRMYQSGDFRVLVGELRFSARMNAWQLRYSSDDGEDAHGGVVRLTGFSPEAHNLNAGMTILVQGELENPAVRESSPSYRVSAFGVIAR